MTYSRLLNLELVLSRRPSSSSCSPNEVLGLPVEEMPYGSFPDDEPAVVSDDDEEALHCEQNAQNDVDMPSMQEIPTQAYPPALGLLCGTLPSMASLHDFLGLPCNLGRRSSEARYSQELGFFCTIHTFSLREGVRRFCQLRICAVMAFIVASVL